MPEQYSDFDPADFAGNDTTPGGDDSDNIFDKFGDGPFKVSEVAQICTVTPWTVRQWLNKPDGHPHKLHGFKLGPRQWRISKDELMRFVAGGGLTQ